MCRNIPKFSNISENPHSNCGNTNMPCQEVLNFLFYLFIYFILFYFLKDKLQQDSDLDFIENESIYLSI